MKRLFAILILAATCFCQVTWKSQDNSIPKIAPKYLLILRYWSTTFSGTGDVVSAGQGWVYMTETYPTLDTVLERLNSSQGAGKFSEDEVVGLWSLDEANKLTLTFRDTEHVKPKHVEEERWTTREWSVLIKKK